MWCVTEQWDRVGYIAVLLSNDNGTEQLDRGGCVTELWNMVCYSATLHQKHINQIVVMETAFENFLSLFVSHKETLYTTGVYSERIKHCTLLASTLIFLKGPIHRLFFYAYDL